MTDDSLRRAPEQTSPPADPPSQPPLGPPGADASASASEAKPGGRRAVVIVVALVAFLGIVLFAVRNNVSADDLAVGDCLNLPNGTSVQTVEKQPCTEGHAAEVFFVGEYSEGTSYPISLALDRYVESMCVPAFEAFAGRAMDDDPALAIGYFYPSRDGWNSGDRTITCYVTRPDEAPMTQSLRG